MSLRRLDDAARQGVPVIEGERTVIVTDVKPFLDVDREAVAHARDATRRSPGWSR